MTEKSALSRSENTLREAFDLYREIGAIGASGGFGLLEAGSGYSAIVKSFIVKYSKAFRPESECGSHFVGSKTERQ